ncbi:hypothetical protein Q3W71_26845 [Micromonospora sp. C28SCA-DRY-2]|nr:hypothetical protein [Micromonospora sp. C28SCA-DRY-2]MDO3705295.1 hypothetical protein [Micromonospora sp. C28SCA-DRY-2]
MSERITRPGTARRHGARRGAGMSERTARLDATALRVGPARDGGTA